MPRRFGPDRLRHILDAVADIETLTAGKTVDDYLDDRLLRLAVERALEIISEASRSIPPTLKDKHPDLPWRGIADFGNVLRHGYDTISDRRVWQIVEHDLPPLEAAIEAMLREAEGGSEPR